MDGSPKGGRFAVNIPMVSTLRVFFKHHIETRSLPSLHVLLRREPWLLHLGLFVLSDMKIRLTRRSLPLVLLHFVLENSRSQSVGHEARKSLGKGGGRRG